MISRQTSLAFRQPATSSSMSFLPRCWHVFLHFQIHVPAGGDRAARVGSDPRAAEPQTDPGQRVAQPAARHGRRVRLQRDSRHGDQQAGDVAAKPKGKSVTIRRVVSINWLEKAFWRIVWLSCSWLVQHRTCCCPSAWTAASTHNTTWMWWVNSPRYVWKLSRSSTITCCASGAPWSPLLASVFAETGIEN